MFTCLLNVYILFIKLYTCIQNRKHIVITTFTKRKQVNKNVNILLKVEKNSVVLYSKRVRKFERSICLWQIQELLQ